MKASFYLIFVLSLLVSQLVCNSIATSEPSSKSNQESKAKSKTGDEEVLHKEPTVKSTTKPTESTKRIYSGSIQVEHALEKSSKFEPRTTVNWKSSIFDADSLTKSANRNYNHQPWESAELDKLKVWVHFYQFSGRKCFIQANILRIAFMQPHPANL
jgi:hypothetical protein